MACRDHDPIHPHSRVHRPDGAVEASASRSERATRQRAAIRQVLHEQGRPMAPPEILQMAQQLVPRLGIATVYRNLKSMVEAGELVPVPLPGERLYYELAHGADHHHHHFRCERCERVFDVEGCDQTFARLLPPGFVMTAHDLTLYGLCSECHGRAGSAAPQR